MHAQRSFGNALLSVICILQYVCTKEVKHYRLAYIRSLTKHPKGRNMHHSCEGTLYSFCSKICPLLKRAMKNFKTIIIVHGLE